MSLDNKFLVFGHRGAAGLEPENTLRSFQRAVDLGVDAIELDVHLKDKRLLVIHDDTVNRCTDGRGSLVGMELAQIRQLDAGLGEKIPFLEEVLASLPDNVAINIEIKSTKGVTGTARAVAELIQKHPARDILVSSFQHEELINFRNHDQTTKVAPLFSKTKPNMQAIALKLGAWSVNLSRELTTEKLVHQLHGSGYKVYVWTVNNPKEAERFQRWGVDGIMTDFPDRFT